MLIEMSKLCIPASIALNRISALGKVLKCIDDFFGRIEQFVNTLMNIVFNFSF